LAIVDLFWAIRFDFLGSRFGTFTEVDVRIYPSESNMGGIREFDTFD
tara:strand:- start:1037 stop:1177 length:141 start_codon:yes stop_codon:yes gene_type:complete